MIQISPRTGSYELRDLFKSFDVLTDTSVDIEFSDFCFYGNGPDGLCRVGIERKRLSDALDSIRTKRLSGHQLGGLCKEFDFVFIVIEGQFKAGEHGELLELKWRDKKLQWLPTSDGKQAVLYRAFQNYFTTSKLKAGTAAGNPVVIERTTEPFETVALVVSHWHWFNDKVWEQHRSHEAVYNKEYQNNNHKPRSFIRRQVSQCEQYMAVAPGLDQAAKSVADRFGSMEGLMKATVEEIAECPVEQWLSGGGKRVVRLGEKKAERIWKSLRSRD